MAALAVWEKGRTEEEEKANALQIADLVIRKKLLRTVYRGLGQRVRGECSPGTEGRHAQGRCV